MRRVPCGARPRSSGRRGKRGSARPARRPRRPRFRPRRWRAVRHRRRPGWRRGGGSDRALWRPASRPRPRRRRRRVRPPPPDARLPASTSATVASAVAARAANSARWAGSSGSRPGASISAGAPGWRRVRARPNVTGWLATTNSIPSRRVNAASCSTAPARCPSAVMTSGAWPASTRRVASRATVSVLPAPGSPANSRGRLSGDSGNAAKVKHSASASSRAPRASIGRSGIGTS